MSNENEGSLFSGALTQEERDTIIEITNIAMGAAGSTLGILLGQEVEIQTPTVTEYGNLAEMEIPFGNVPKTMVMVQYIKGVYATSLFLIKNADARSLAAMMLGDSGAEGDELNDMELSAIGEVMNQMMNAAATGLASAIGSAVEINNPQVIPYSSDMLAQCLPQVLSEPFAVNTIPIKCGSVGTIELLEFRVTSEIQAQVAQFLSAPEEASRSEAAEAPTGPMGDLMDDVVVKPAMAAAASPRAAQQGGMNVDPVTVRPVEFASFDQQPNIYGEENKNLQLVMDVTLNLTVELGKTELSIKEVLELTRGSVIELERVAGEPVDLMANGKLIAKGEVVVIEDNFGLRITSIISPADRLRGL
jgi:flagellar motor switch protein FliN